MPERTAGLASVIKIASARVQDTEFPGDINPTLNRLILFVGLELESSGSKVDTSAFAPALLYLLLPCSRAFAGVTQ